MIAKGVIYPRLPCTSTVLIKGKKYIADMWYTPKGIVYELTDEKGFIAIRTEQQISDALRDKKIIRLS